MYENEKYSLRNLRFYKIRAKCLQVHCTLSQNTMGNWQTHFGMIYTGRQNLFFCNFILLSSAQKLHHLKYEKMPNLVYQCNAHINIRKEHPHIKLQNSFRGFRNEMHGTYKLTQKDLHCWCITSSGFFSDLIEIELLSDIVVWYV